VNFITWRRGALKTFALSLAASVLWMARTLSELQQAGFRYAT
jgi:hypothetical protein